MPQVEIDVGGRTFEVACQPGEEAFLRSAAAMLDAEAQTVAEQIGRMPEGRMLLMAGLMLADKAAGLEDRLREAEARLAQAQAEVERRPQTVEVPVEVPVEVRVEVPVIPAEVRQLFADVAEETEALAHAVASLVPPERAA
jgi:cell division protein ZapA